MANKKVTIMLDNNLIQVCPDPVYVSVSGKDQVVWEIEPNHDFDVIFPKNEPFKDYKFHGRKGTPAPSGEAKDGTQHKHYKYTIQIADVPPLDPTVRPIP